MAKIMVSVVMMAVMAAEGLLVVAAPAKEKRTRLSADQTKVLVELAGGESDRHVKNRVTADGDLRDAERYLQRKGYWPIGSTALYTEDSGKKRGKKFDDVEVILWAWEDGDRETGTGILYTRNRNSGKAEVDIVELSRNGEVLWQRQVTRKDGRRAGSFEVPVGLVGERGFYQCSAAGCGVAAIVGFLFGPMGFAAGCTAALLNCAYQNM